MSSLLKEGDIIELQRGHCVYFKLPAHFIYTNAVGDFSTLDETEVVIGEPKKGLDTSFLAGRYVVTKANAQGGGTGMGPHDVYPDGWHVQCQRLVPRGDPSTWNGHTIKVSFYQTGSFTAMIRTIAPVGRAKAEWSEGV